MAIGYNAYVDTKEDVLSMVKTVLNKNEELAQANKELTEQCDIYRECIIIMLSGMERYRGAAENILRDHPWERLQELLIVMVYNLRMNPSEIISALSCTKGVRLCK